MEQPETMDPEPEPEPEPGLDGESELTIETARREVAAQRNKLLDDALVKQEELPRASPRGRKKRVSIGETKTETIPAREYDGLGLGPHLMVAVCCTRV